MPLILRIRRAMLAWRETVLEAEVANGHALMRDHQERLAVATVELESVRRRIATLNAQRSAPVLLSEALRRG